MGEEELTASLSSGRSRWPRLGWLVLLLLIGGTLLWQFSEPLGRILGDLEGLRAWVAALGAWGPIAIIVLGIVQVLIAPLPGYPLVFVSGLLFGGWWGAIYANIGMLIAGLLAARLARTFGRPLAERFVEGIHLQQAERLLASDSVWLWFFVLLLPTGDLPYFAAGLSRIPLRRFAVALFWARFPFTFVLTYAASRATELPQGPLFAMIGVAVLLAAVAYRQQARLQLLFHDVLDRVAEKPHRSPHDSAI